MNELTHIHSALSSGFHIRNSGVEKLVPVHSLPPELVLTVEWLLAPQLCDVPALGQSHSRESSGQRFWPYGVLRGSWPPPDAVPE